MYSPSLFFKKLIFIVCPKYSCLYQSILRYLNFEFKRMKYFVHQFQTFEHCLISCIMIIDCQDLFTDKWHHLFNAILSTLEIYLKKKKRAFELPIKVLWIFQQLINFFSRGLDCLNSCFGDFN